MTITVIACSLPEWATISFRRVLFIRAAVVRSPMVTFSFCVRGEMVKRARPYHGCFCKCCLRSAGFLSALTPYISRARRMTLFWRRRHAAGGQLSRLSAMNVYELLFSNLWCFCHRAARVCASYLSPLNTNPPRGFGDQTAIRQTAMKHRCKCLGEWRWSWTHRTCVNANASPISMNQLHQEGAKCQRITE